MYTCQSNNKVGRKNMNSFVSSAEKQAHVVCIPFPCQGHIKALLKLAKLLHIKGIFVTFVNTEFNHKRFLSSGGLSSLNGLPGFRFESIPDGIPPSDPDTTQDGYSLCHAIVNNLLPPFQDLLNKLNAQTPPVTSILSDGFMPFTADAAHSIGIPVVLVWTFAACAFMGFYQFKSVLEKGLVPLKDKSYLTNGYLNTSIDWIPGMRDIQLRDLPTNIRITDPNDLMFNYIMDAAQRASYGTGIVLYTFDDLEQEVLNAISSMFPNIYTIGPQQLLLNQIASDHDGDQLKNIRDSLWEEDKTCIQWLDSKEADSVVYVNFGSITVMSPEQTMEFCWGLVNSNHNFLWIIRPDLVVGESKSTLELQFVKAMKERCFITSWCPQEEVLNHKSVGGFLTHGGWNSITESISAGVPMLCWPYFGDQLINCKYMCTEWGCGMEIDHDVKRDNVEKLVRILMDGVEGKRMKKKAVELKQLAEKACSHDGSSTLNFNKLLLLLKN